MKKCIVLSGEYRTFDKTYEGIKNFIQSNDLDVYCSLWFENQEQVEKIQSELNPKNLLILHYDQFRDSFHNIERNIRKNNPKEPNQDKLSGNASMYFCRQTAFDLVPKGEYDILVYCRYDIDIKQNILIQNVDTIVTPLEESYDMISDIFAIMPMSMADSYFLFDDYERLHSTPIEPEIVDWMKNVNKNPEYAINQTVKMRYCPHLLLARSILLNGHKFSKMDLPVSILR